MTMSLLSRWTTLALALALCAVDAATLRGVEELDSPITTAATTTTTATATATGTAQRGLKSSKSGFTPVAPPVPPTTSVTATTTSITVGTTASNNNNSIENRIVEFEATCGDQQIQELERCVIQYNGDTNLCKQCVLGVNSLSNPNQSNLMSCTSPNISGGPCRPQCKAQLATYFNCGAGTSFVATSSTTTTTSVTATTTSTSVSSGGFAPIETCNAITETPKSGEGCSVPGSYAFRRCYFPGFECTCRKDQPLWLCHVYPAP